MALEVGTHISDLVQTNPVSTDGLGQADDHIRLIKKTIRNTFPNITGPVLATQAELNLIDGITATTTELNKLDGFSGGVSDLNKLASVTASASELNTLDGITATTAEINKLDGVVATTAELNTMAGITSSTTELNKLDGYSGTATDLSILAGAAAAGVSSTEFRRINGVTSDIQTQLDARVSKSGGTMTGPLDVPTVNVTTVDLGQWTITEVSGVLRFYVNGTGKMKLDTYGNLTVVGDVTAFGEF